MLFVHQNHLAMNRLNLVDMFGGVPAMRITGSPHSVTWPAGTDSISSSRFLPRGVNGLVIVGTTEHLLNVARYRAPGIGEIAEQFA